MLPDPTADSSRGEEENKQKKTFIYCLFSRRNSRKCLVGKQQPQAHLGPVLFVSQLALNYTWPEVEMWDMHNALRSPAAAQLYWQDTRIRWQHEYKKIF